MSDELTLLRGLRGDEGGEAIGELGAAEAEKSPLKMAVKKFFSMLYDGSSSRKLVIRSRSESNE